MGFLPPERHGVIVRMGARKRGVHHEGRWNWDRLNPPPLSARSNRLPAVVTAFQLPLATVLIKR